MPKRRSHVSTVASVESSLRNLDYEPSVQESVDESTHSDGESALSSVLSSVKRTLRKQQQSSVKTCSTRQSEGMLWQDSESEAELYSTSSDEEEADLPRNTTAKGKQNKNIKAKTSDHESISTTEGSTYPSDASSTDAKSRHLSTETSKSKARKETEKSSNKKPKETKASRQQEPFKRLRFSTEALAEAAQSRMNEPTRHTMIPKEEIAEGFELLQDVDYLSHLDAATTNQDISTLHPLGKEECDQIFKSQVPFVVPVIQSCSDDDMSSIQGVSIKVGAKEKNLEIDLENQKGHKLTSPEVKTTAKVSSAKEGSAPEPTEATKHTTTQPAYQRIFSSWVSDRSGYELFFSTLIGVSLITLIILLGILFGT